MDIDTVLPIPITPTGGAGDPAVLAVAAKAAALISSGMKVGLGSGRASTEFIRAQSEKWRPVLKDLNNVFD